MTPEGYVPIADFPRAKGLTPEKVINMIRDGFYVGQKVGDDWFVSRAELSGSHKQGGGASTSTTVALSDEIQRVVVTEVNMPFGSMVMFLVKPAIAAIPAFIILFMLFTVLTAMFGGIFIGISR